MRSVSMMRYLKLIWGKVPGTRVAIVGAQFSLKLKQELFYILSTKSSSLASLTHSLQTPRWFRAHESMVLNQTQPKCLLWLRDGSLTQAEELKYLGILLSSNGPLWKRQSWAQFTGPSMFHRKLWLQDLGSERNNEIMDTSSWHLFPSEYDWAWPER